MISFLKIKINNVATFLPVDKIRRVSVFKGDFGDDEAVVEIEMMGDQKDGSKIFVREKYERIKIQEFLSLC